MRKRPPCGCDKRLYESYEQALGSLLSCTRRRGTPLRIYRCPEVPGGWHLTSKPRVTTWVSVGGYRMPAHKAMP